MNLELNYAQLLELIEKLENSSLSEISVSNENTSFTLRKEITVTSSYQSLGPSGQFIAANGGASENNPSLPEVSLQKNLIEVFSPIVGTFYSASSPDSKPFVEIGQQVRLGETFCIIEAMKVMNEFNAEQAGIVAEICVKNGQPVEYGQVLFRLQPE